MFLARERVARGSTQPRERLPEPDAAADDDVAVAAPPGAVNFFGEVAAGDGSAGPVGSREGTGEHHLARGVLAVQRWDRPWRSGK